MSDGTVIATGLNLRKSLATGTVVKVLRKSSRVEILGEETWYRVKTRDGLEGFVFGDFVEKDLGLPGEPAPLPDVPSPTCELRHFSHERFIGDAITADEDFFPFLDRIAGFAKDTRLFVFVTSSTRDPGTDVRGAIVTPAKRSNHLVGHAIDMNLRSESGSFFNSKKLKDLANQPKDVRDFIAKIRQDPDLRWGGDFTARDVVHIDDELNRKQPELWDSKLASRA